MRRFVSSICLLLQIIAMLVIFATVSGTQLCEELKDTGHLIDQMRQCNGDMLGFSSSTNPVFDLSALTQDEIEKIAYKRAADRKTPDPGNPKTFKGHVIIKNSRLKSFNLGIKNLGQQQKVEIIGNNDLDSFTIQIDEDSEADVRLILRGNKELSIGSIKMLKKIPQINKNNSIFQEYQECFFQNAAVKDLSELEGCSAIDGDLIINSATNIPDPLPLIRIKNIRKGCLRIENSNLKNINFLEGLLGKYKREKCAASGQPQIKGNKHLCINSEDRPKWDSIAPLDYTGTTCLDRCTVDFAKKNPTQTIAPCDVVIGDVQITGSPSATDMAHWDRVKILEGTLEVSSTNLQDIVIFKNLEKIINPSAEKIALAVIKNPQMAKFQLPKLTNITMPPDALSEPIFFQDNGDFKFTVAEGEKWKQIAGSSFVMIPMEPPPSTIAIAPAVTTMSSKQIDDLNKQIEDKNDNIKRDEILIIFGWSVGLCAVMFAVCGLIVWCVNRRIKKGKLVKKDDDLATSMQLEEKPGVKKSEPVKAKNKKIGEEPSSDVTIQSGVEAEHPLSWDDSMLINMVAKSFKHREFITQFHIAMEAEEISFKATDVIKDIDAPEMDIEKARGLLKEHKLPKMKHTGKPYRHIYQYKFLFFNPKALNLEPVPYIEKYDRNTVFKCLITHCSEFFLTNAHLLPDVIADCSGPYYTPNGTLLAEVDGPVYVIGDLHEALHVLQTILNLDLFGEGKKHKIHPMFRHKYIFLGDYLDRGYHGLEVFFLLCIAVRLFPELFTVLRGNHDGLPSKWDDWQCIMTRYAVLLKKKKIKIAFPYHFSDCMLIDIYTKVTPYLPMAAIINGQTFAAHGGLSLGMAIGNKSIREIFKEIPVPYYDENRFKMDLFGRYPPFHAVHQSENEEFKKIYDIHIGDEYTTRLNKLREEVEEFELENRKYWNRRKMDPKKNPPDPRYEWNYSPLYSIMWSDPSPVLASAGNHRQAGCTYNTELVLKMMKNNKSKEANKSIEDIIRAHQVVGIAYSCDDRVTTVFSNCNHTQNLMDIEVSEIDRVTGLFDSASILRINEDGSRTIILMSMTTEKKAEQALVNPNKKKKRPIVGLVDLKDVERRSLKKNE